MKLFFTVDEKYSGRTVYDVLRHQFHLSASMIRRLKHSNGIFVNSFPVFTNFTISAGDIVSADIMSAEPECGNMPEKGPIDVIFEDEGLIAVNKPCGILVHPSHARYMGTLSNFVSGYLLETTGFSACHAVNRLDRDTSGVVLFAKNSHMKDLASKALSDDFAIKEYEGIVIGGFSDKEGTINLPIARKEEGNMLRIVSPDGKPSVTHYKVSGSGIINGSIVSVLKFILESGRTHQIRVHCSAIGHPLLGDTLYFSEASKTLSESIGIKAQALHARSLVFHHPLTGKEISLTAPIKREDMEKIFRIII